MAKRSGWFLISFCLVALLASNVYAAPIVSFNVSGSPNDWTLDFSVTNTLGDSNNIYFFGVQLPATDITANPSGWGNYGSWSPSGFGGSRINYNNIWLTYDYFGVAVQNGHTLSGFVARDTADATAPTSVPWFAFAYGGSYSGTDHFNTDMNPGFEGSASPSSVPLPPTVFLLGSGLLGLAGWRRFGKS
jgi:hypothetical protein